MRLQRNVSAETVNQSAQHKLFVEGKDNQEIDAVILKELLKNNGLSSIDVQTMGACDNVHNAAQALFPYHPTYYFLIDRDVQEQSEVNKSWDNFPDPTTHNKLIWQKRELENYFIDPNYLKESAYLKPNINIEERILDEANRRVFMDAANLTLAKLKNGIREIAKAKGIFKEFANFNDFKNKDGGLILLNERSTELSDKLKEEENTVKNNIADIYNNFLNELSGGVSSLQYGYGNWLERMSGKEIFKQIANQCFHINGSSRTLKSKEKNNIIAKQLVSLPINQQPQDFQKLVECLKNRISL
jgi:hypothetical protein